MFHHPDAMTDPARLSLPRLIAALESTSTPHLPEWNHGRFEDARLGDLDSPLRLEAALCDLRILGRVPLVLPPAAAAGWQLDLHYLFRTAESLPGGASRLRSIHALNTGWQDRCASALASPAGLVMDGTARTRLAMLADGLEIGLRFLDRHQARAGEMPQRAGFAELVTGAVFDADPHMIQLGLSTWRTVEERDWCTASIRESANHDFRLRTRGWRGWIVDTFRVTTGWGRREWVPGPFATPTAWTLAEVRALYVDHQAAEADRAKLVARAAEAAARREATKAARLAEEDTAERARKERQAARYHRARAREIRRNEEHLARLG